MKKYIKKEVEKLTSTKEIDLLAKALGPQDLTDQRKIYDLIDWAVDEIELLLKMRARLYN